MSIIRRLNAFVLNSYKYSNNCVNTCKTSEPVVNRIVVSLKSTGRMTSFQFSTLNELKVQHNVKKHQFFVKLGSDTAVLDYRDVSPGVVDLFHTEVPKDLHGKGIAKILAQEAFDYVVRNDLQMIVSCTYLQKFLKDNQKEEYLKRLFQTED